MWISAASQWEYPFDRGRSIAMRTMTYSPSCDISSGCFFHRKASVAVLEGCTVGRTWEQLRLLREARGLSGKCCMRRQSNAMSRKRSAPQVLNLVSKLLIHEMPGSCARWGLGHFVFINQRNAGYESNYRNSSIYSPSSRLHLHSLFHWYPSHRRHPILPRHIWLAENNLSRSKTHPITYTTLYVPCVVPSPGCNCIIILMLRM